MRELTSAEMHDVSGAGLFSFLSSALTAVGGTLGFDGSFGYSGGGGGLSFSNFGSAVGGALGAGFTAFGDISGFDGAFGYDGSSVSDFSLGNFAGEVVGTALSLPNTIIGTAIGTAGFLLDYVPFIGDFNASINLIDGELHFQNNPLIFGENAALTLGDAQIFEGVQGAQAHDGQGSFVSFSVGEHENIHSLQSNIFGPLFLPLYAVGGVIAVLNGDSFFGNGNFLESGPYDASGPNLF